MTLRWIVTISSTWYCFQNFQLYCQHFHLL